MTRVSRSGYRLLVVIVCWVGVNCQLRRPKTTPSRMIEPQMLEPELPDAARQVAKAPNAAPVRLLEVEAREHIGRRVLHQQPGGELTEDSVWRWSSAPDRYLDTALRLEVASSSDLRLVDAGSAPALAATILVWNLELCGRNPTRRGSGVSDHGDRPCRPYTGGAGQRAGLSGATRRLGSRRGSTLAPACVPGPHIRRKRTISNEVIADSFRN